MRYDPCEYIDAMARKLAAELFLVTLNRLAQS